MYALACCYSVAEIIGEKVEEALLYVFPVVSGAALGYKLDGSVGAAKGTIAGLCYSGVLNHRITNMKNTKKH
jgi:hypothetical protein